MKKRILCLIMALCMILMCAMLAACDSEEVVEDGDKQGSVHNLTDNSAAVDPNMPNQQIPDNTIRTQS